MDEEKKPRRQRKPHPIRNLVLVSIAVFILYWTVSILIYNATVSFTGSANELFQQFAVRLPVGLAVYTFLRKKHPEKVRRIPKKRFALLLLSYMALVEVPFQIAHIGISTGAAANTTGGATDLDVINLLMAAPFIEELTYRGVLFGLYRRRTGFWQAAIAVSVIFGLSHFSDPLNVVTSTFFGITACCLREAAGTIRYGIALHMIFNWIGPLIAIFLVIRIPMTVGFFFLAAGLVFQLAMLLNKDRLLKMLLPESPLAAPEDDEGDEEPDPSPERST